MKKKRKWNSYKLLLFALPGILLVTIFHYIPLWGWSFAFFQYKPGKSVFDCLFVGWDNFAMLFKNAVLRNNLVRVLKNTFGMHLLAMVFGPLPMLFAVFLNEVRSKKFQKVIQTATTLPHFVSWVIVYSLLVALVGNSGLINVLLENSGLDVRVNLLNTDRHVWLIQNLFGLWKQLGWNAIVYFAAVAGIDQELYEAAMVDGAGRFQKMWYITLPLLIPTYFVLLIIGIGNFLNTGVSQHLVFANALNKEYIETLDLYVYNLGIGSGQISFSVAVGIMKSMVALVLFTTANYASKKVRGTSVF